MLFGLLALFMVAALLLGGVVAAIVVSLQQYQATRSIWYALCCFVGIAFSALALSFSVIWPFMHAGEGDWSYGQMDTFKTPLGGGFYLASIDSPKELPLPLYQRSAQGNSDVNSDSQLDTAVALACTAGVVSVKTSHDVVVIDRSGRTLSRVNTTRINTVEPPRWLTLAEFAQTPCAQPTASSGNSLKMLMGLLAGPLLSGVVLLALWLGQPRRRRTTL